MELLLNKLLLTFERHGDRDAFYIRERRYTYADFERKISEIQHLILHNIPDTEKYVGILITDEPETYASIYALWFCGKAFVPLSSLNPSYRNTRIANNIPLKYILYGGSVPISAMPDGRLKFLNTKNTRPGVTKIQKAEAPDICNAYILFTSGTTGEPKGVPINRGNLNSFIRAFTETGYTFEKEDRFLQIYDLSFDASVFCYTFPLMYGACIYTVPQDKIKYLYAYRLINDHKLTFIKMTPSTLTYLQPYFESINLKHVRYCMIGGEAFSSGLAAAWQRCVPNALIQNVYGPTETTAFTLLYDWNRGKAAYKSYNDMISIGKTLKGNHIVIVDEKNAPLKVNQKGELCIAGERVTSGYWGDKDRTKKSFFELHTGDKSQRFYKTGDIAFMDNDGYVMFCGRQDTQVQIQGYRVELGEIEKHARDFLGEKNLAILAGKNAQGNERISLFTENIQYKETELIEHLRARLPHYMIPSEVINMKEIPRTTSGKIDRKTLYKMI